MEEGDANKRPRAAGFSASLAGLHCKSRDQGGWGRFIRRGVKVADTVPSVYRSGFCSRVKQSVHVRITHGAMRSSRAAPPPPLSKSVG
uniref:Uncharacterized protein n=1 Tax=Arundo donax TaxID=35708 RepID=A0A0A9DAX2_ARUDO